MARNKSEKNPQHLAERKVRHGDGNITCPLRLERVGTSRWCVTLAPPARFQVDTRFRHFNNANEAADAYSTFPNPFLYADHCHSKDGWVRITQDASDAA